MIKIANHEINGPGITGTKLPVIPIKQRIKPETNKIISMKLFNPQVNIFYIFGA